MEQNKNKNTKDKIAKRDHGKKEIEPGATVEKKEN